MDRPPRADATHDRPLIGCDLPCLGPASPRSGDRVGFLADRRASTAVEFALVAMPFITLLLALPQMAIYFMTQSSLDAGVLKTADTLVNTYYANAAPPAMTAASLKNQVVGNAGGTGGLIRNDASLSVELRKLSALDGAIVPVGNTVDPNAPQDVLVLRAKASVTSFVPLIGTLSVQSAAIVRRQAL